MWRTPASGPAGAATDTSVASLPPLAEPPPTLPGDAVDGSDPPRQGNLPGFEKI